MPAVDEGKGARNSGLRLRDIDLAKGWILNAFFRGAPPEPDRQRI